MLCALRTMVVQRCAGRGDECASQQQAAGANLHGENKGNGMKMADFLRCQAARSTSPPTPNLQRAGVAMDSSARPQSPPQDASATAVSSAPQRSIEELVMEATESDYYVQRAMSLQLLTECEVHLLCDKVPQLCILVSHVYRSTL